MNSPTVIVAPEDVVVGVDGSQASVQAIAYGLEEAGRCGSHAHIVHVVSDYYVAVPMYAMPFSELVAAGRRALGDALERAGIGADDPRITSLLLRGSPAATLVSHARRARVLVVGSDRRPLPARLMTGNTNTGVVASAPLPVVSVPEGWESQPARGVVLVAVKHAAHSAEVLGEAFAVADSRRSRLIVIHVWSSAAAHESLTNDRLPGPDWDKRARALLIDLVGRWADAYPSVAVEVRVAHGQAAHVLVQASAEVDELVLVRRGHGVPAAMHLGATARAVLREASCPVRVVPPDHVRGFPGLVLEQDGDLQK